MFKCSALGHNWVPLWSGMGRRGCLRCGKISEEIPNAQKKRK